MDITVAIDAMGGDHGPHVTVPAALAYLKRDAEVNIVLVGLAEVIEAELQSLKASVTPRLRIHHASEVVTMDDPPALALRNKKDSSMRVAINLVKTGEANACVSAGNTGALMAISRFVLKMLPGIERPAIAGDDAHAERPYPRARSWSQCGLHCQSSAPVRGHGRDAGFRCGA